MVSVVAVYFMMKIVYHQVFKNSGLKFGNSSYFFAKKGYNLKPNRPTFFCKRYEDRQIQRMCTFKLFVKMLLVKLKYLSRFITFNGMTKYTQLTLQSVPYNESYLNITSRKYALFLAGCYKQLSIATR